MMQPRCERKPLVAMSQDKTAHDFRVHIPFLAIAPGHCVWCPHEVFGDVVFTERFSQAIRRCSVFFGGDNSNPGLLRRVT